MAGAVVHFEIPADDPERAQDFYREAFGWGVDPMPDMSYAMLRTCLLYTSDAADEL